MNSTWLITSELANQQVPKALFSCGVYTNNDSVKDNFQTMKTELEMMLNIKKNENVNVA